MFFGSYPLARRLTLLVIILSVMFAAISTTVQVVISYHKEIVALDTRLQDINIIEAPGLSNSIWHFDETQIGLQLQGMLNIQHISFVEVQVYDGENFSVGVQPGDKNAKIEEIDLTYTQDGKVYDIGKLIVMADLSSVRSGVQSWLFSTVILSLLQTLLLSGIFLFVVIRIITRPLGEIVKYADAIDLNHLDQPLALKPRRFSPDNDELEQVVVKLNEMRLRLIENINRRLQMEAALRENEKNYQEIFNATSDGIIIRKASDGSIVEVNNAVLKMYGYDAKEEIISTQISELSANDEDQSNEIAEEKMNLAINNQPQIFEWLAKKKNGESFWVEVSLRASAIAGNDYILSVIRDITERKNAQELLIAQNEALVNQSLELEEAQEKTKQLNEELEHRVQERTIQLEALNQELEAFSYSVAHDLRAPLRHITGFSQVILDEYGKNLNEEIVGWLKRIQDSSQNLYNMVEALLGLSRVTRDSIQIMRINLSNMVNRIAEQLQNENPEREVKFEIEDDVFVQADLRLLKILVENIMLNAWKFSANNNVTEIKFGTFAAANIDKPIKNYQCFFIQDNGVGFDMTYIDRLFGPFQRLHSASDFSGTGIGLATVKRIVQRHGGIVWAEAMVDKGATFYFCFPNAKGTESDNKNH